MQQNQFHILGAVSGTASGAPHAATMQAKLATDKLND
jgi:hypothetical protein